MADRQLSVRELLKSDIPFIVNYWHTADTEFLLSMGVDINKLPDSNTLPAMLSEQLNTPIEQKRSYCLIWLVNGKPIGHCNTNPTAYGDHAYMHLHIWNTAERKMGLGTEFIKKSLPFFFDKLKLKALFCQPYAHNPAPNKTLEKAGFRYDGDHFTTPGSINFEQWVKRWRLSAEEFSELYH